MSQKGTKKPNSSQSNNKKEQQHAEWPYEKSNYDPVELVDPLAEGVKCGDDEVVLVANDKTTRFACNTKALKFYSKFAQGTLDGGVEEDVPLDNKEATAVTLQQFATWLKRHETVERSKQAIPMPMLSTTDQYFSDPWDIAFIRQHFVGEEEDMTKHEPLMELLLLSIYLQCDPLTEMICTYIGWHIQKAVDPVAGISRWCAGNVRNKNQHTVEETAEWIRGTLHDQGTFDPGRRRSMLSSDDEYSDAPCAHEAQTAGGDGTPGAASDNDEVPPTSTSETPLCKDRVARKDHVTHFLPVHQKALSELDDDHVIHFLPVALSELLRHYPFIVAVLQAFFRALVLMVPVARMKRVQGDEERYRGVLERKAEKSREELKLKWEIRTKFLAGLRAPAGDSVAACRVEALQRCFSDGEEGRDSDEIDDSEESLPTRDPPIVKTLCPYSRTRLILPVRSIKCHHGASQCIDLDSFLATSVMRVKNHEPYLKVKCIVCGQEVDSMDLVLDLWVKEIIDKVFASPKNRNVTMVNINEDGTWSIPPPQVRKDVLVVDEADIPPVDSTAASVMMNTQARVTTARHLDPQYADKKNGATGQPQKVLTPTQRHGSNAPPPSPAVAGGRKVGTKAKRDDTKQPGAKKPTMGEAQNDEEPEEDDGRAAKRPRRE